MINQPIERRTSIAILFGLLAMIALSIGAARAMPYNTDCMKNPFASGCRGISAKRSAAQQQIWSPDQAKQVQSHMGDGRATRASFYDLISAHQMGQQRASQLGVVADLLVEAAHRLANLAEWNGAATSKEAPQLGGYLVSSSMATAKRAMIRNGQREEASS